ncbi:MAG: GxxExxY protein [Phycisphaera sp.]|nr:MAG: GxxExxY protein [Phycisphaera sp.]
MEVHTHLGPGLLESLYEDALCVELASIGIPFERQVETVVDYKGVPLRSQRLDVVVDRQIIVELKSVERVHEVHKAQLLSYLRMSKLPLGLLINFNTQHLRDGLNRVINERALPTPPSPLRPLRSKLPS